MYGLLLRLNMLSEGLNVLFFVVRKKFVTIFALAFAFGAGIIKHKCENNFALVFW